MFHARAVEGVPTEIEPPRPVDRPLAVADYVRPGGDRPEAADLRLAPAEAATYADPAPGTLFTHPEWLRAYGAGALVVVEGVGREPVPRLVFARERDHLRHLGRLSRFEPALVEALAERLLQLDGVAFVTFEDIDLAAPLPRGPRRAHFRYQNNWRLVLNGVGAEAPSRSLVKKDANRTRALKREHPEVRIDFEPGPDRAALDALFEFGRARIEGQARRYGIDAAEADRLARVAAATGHGTVVRNGETVIAADLVCDAGGHAYFLTHGYDPGYPRSSLGMLLVLNSIAACRARGLGDFNLMWGDLPYKARAGAKRVELTTVVAWRAGALPRPSLLAALARFGWYEIKRRLKARLRPEAQTERD